MVVAGAIANKPNSGGEAWVRLSWIRGLQRLGLDVRFVEELSSADAAAANATYFRTVVDRFGLDEIATLLVDGEAIVGSTVDDLVTLAQSAVLVNISGHLSHPRLFPAFRTRVFVDIDPGFTQFWHAAGNAAARVQGHDLHFTIGENIGMPGCSIPTGDIRWRHVRQPVVLDDWPVSGMAEPFRFTTVANWRGPFGPLEHAGRTYGLKVHEFRKFIELPRRSPQRFELALNIHPDEERDIIQLRDNGWKLVDPLDAAGSPDAFRSYIQGSGAEFSVAQGVYVDTNSGWFSDRTIRYLASGKPALVQDTGFGHSLPTGTGLVAFRTLADAVSGVSDILREFDAHRRAARAIAEGYFSSDEVLQRFWAEVGCALPR